MGAMKNISRGRRSVFGRPILNEAKISRGARIQNQMGICLKPDNKYIGKKKAVNKTVAPVKINAIIPIARAIICDSCFLLIC